ncbi:ABC transporter ATP-binding protein [Mycoplasma feriruminatoris]|uniref:ABC transporter ATP-binding protein n=1 Tax=Mycoplasma feriruminatoris TaxID=1179777 RepID=UPI0002A50783|nr:ABC transporter ATP-binding protein [Mycoplasma feriruminatoris]UKS54077.1 ABC transporter family protein [Mycoplasma feriruminatoris]VZK65245.1 Ferric enterobactin transport ATP-binding protein FepC [Mycoplasma feriruminatoris]VZR75390.1 Ferric enterobactin transport ATP-binding protein FepC [Mycoplasma feriruminatoris]VZR97631.1 Ferric enterobactin transport ATP-binding protein FepC [Mycoplasma feriruminatoris]
MSLIEVKNVTKKYNKKTVLGPVSLEIKKGSSVAIFGANGAGKTTLCEIIANTKSQTSGEVLYDFKKEEIAFKIGVNFQSQTYPSFINVKELISFYKSLYKNIIDKSYFDQMVKIFKLDELYKQKVTSLSGGQRQRVNLFVSLFNKPEIYIGDEITTGLDVEAQLEIIDLLKKEIKDKGMTLILVSHNLDEIKQLCDRIIFLDKGKIIDDAPIDQILDQYGTLLEYYLSKTNKLNKGEIQ